MGKWNSTKLNEVSVEKLAEMIIRKNRRRDKNCFVELPDVVRFLQVKNIKGTKAYSVGDFYNDYFLNQEWVV